MSSRRGRASLFFRFGIILLFLVLPVSSGGNAVCTISPLGEGMDDTENVMDAISRCGTNGNIVLSQGNFNITSKMEWNLTNTIVDLLGTLNFAPDIEFWLNENNTFRVVFIQSQASWFVATGTNFTIDAHGTGGINGNAFTLFRANDAFIRNFKVESPPFWCNTVAESENVVYDGMICNAQNRNATFAGQNIVPNTDGIDTYRSDNINLLNWDITSGDDCLAIKGNTTNLLAKNVTCRGGNGIAFGSLGQYANLFDIVLNVTLEDVHNIRLNSSIQPNMGTGVYFKSWTGSINGSPPTGGGGGGGLVKNITAKDFVLNEVDLPVHVYQTNGGHSDDTPSFLQFADLRFINFTGSSTGDTRAHSLTLKSTSANQVVELACSSNAPCPNITFDAFDVSPPAGDNATFTCENTVNVTGLGGGCAS